MQKDLEAELDQLSIEMFKTFARFEYALKAAGFHKGDGKADPDWQAFALSIDSALVNPQTPELKAAIDYITQQPPMKQVIKDGLLEWDSSIPTNAKSQGDLILLYVRRVRNNLFHGGKFNGHWFAPQRSKELLQNSLTILQVCLNESPQVKNAFDSR